jgi:glycerol-3-phosphate dehydrogenase
MSKKTDVLIIGGGISGISVSRELSKYDLDVTLVEKEADVGWGQTKASYANRHPGARWTPGTLAQQMIAEANQMMDQFIEDLDIDFRRSGELVLAFNKDELEVLKTMKKQGDFINIEGLEFIGPDEIKRMEPNVNPAVFGALYMPTAGIFNPFEQIMAFYENARDNGVDMLIGTEVTGIISENGKFIVETNRDEIQAGYIVNAAGLFAEKVAKMAGADSFKISYDTKSTCIILDPLLGDIVRHIVTGLNNMQFTRYKLVTPTFDDKILIYTTFPEPAKGIEDRAVEKRMIDFTVESVKILVPDVDFEKYVVAAYSGLTARNDRSDFIIEASEKLPTFVNVAIPPPGITCSPAIGKRVAEILKGNGLMLREKTNFNPYRKSMRSLRASSPMQVRELVKKDPNYGNVVCRCETVTEGEITDAIKRGATTLDGVKFRTRAGMGRCQANFCGPKVTGILARELDQPLERVTKKGHESNYVIKKG